MPNVGPAPRPDDPLAHLYRTDPPPGSPLHRGWLIWYDSGLYQTGIIYRETVWWARNAAGDNLQARDWDQIIEAIDDVVDLLGGPTEPRQPKR